MKGCLFIKKYLKSFFVVVFVVLGIGICLYRKSIPMLYVWLSFVIAACLGISIIKILKKYPRIEVCFLTIFFVSLIVPTVAINQNKISVQENRRLAVLKPFLNKKGKIDYDFGKSYENYLKDHFFLRDNLIYLYHNILYRLSIFIYKNNKIFLIKKTNYFLTKGTSTNVLKEDMETVGKYFQNFRDYLAEKGIKFYVVTTPTKDSIFRNHNLALKKQIKSFPNRDHRYVSSSELENILNEKYHINYIDMTKMYQNKLNEYLPVYKTDHHSTDYGYFLTYTRLMEMIKKDFSDIKVNTIEDFNLSKNKLVRHNSERTFHLGVEHNISNIRDDDILDVMYTFFDYKNLDNITVQHPEKNHQFHTNPDGKYRLLLIGDSSIDGWIYFLDTSFAEIDAYRVNQKKYPFEVKPFYKVIDKFKPDAVVFFRQIGAFNQFKTMYPQRKKGKK